MGSVSEDDVDALRQALLSARASLEPSIVESYDEDFENDIVEEEYQREISEHEAFNEYQQKRCTQKQIMEKLHMSKKQAFNLAHGLRRMDGSSDPGRRTALTPAQELLLGRTVQKLAQEDHIALSGAEVSHLAQMLYQLHGGTNIPKFGPNWRKGFNERNPSFALVAERVAPLTLRRAEASTLSSVARAMNSLKAAFGKCLSNNVYTVDELQISENGEGMGERRMCVGHVRPIHTSPDNTPHISAAPFVCLSGEVPYIGFVVQAATRPAIESSDTFLTDADIFYNDKGSVDSQNWPIMIERFCGVIDRKHGPPERRLNEKVVLIFDGYTVHLDKVALATLEQHGVTTICLSPNITHLVQLNDNSHINGRIQGEMRALKVNYCALNNGKFPSYEKWCRMAADKIRGVAMGPSVVTAAKEVGFKFDGDFVHVWMDDESVESTLRVLVAEGRVIKDAASSDETSSLRHGDYVAVLKMFHDAGIKKPDLIGEDSVAIAAECSRAFIKAKTGSAPVQRLPRLRRNALDMHGRGRTRVLSDPKRQFATSNLRAAEEKKEAEERKKRAYLELKTARDTRMTELQARFPGIDLSRMSLGTYKSGKRTIQQATETVQRALNKRAKVIIEPAVPVLNPPAEDTRSGNYTL